MAFLITTPTPSHTKRMTYFGLAFLGAIAILIGFIWFCNVWILQSSRERLYSQAESIPPNDVGLVLGTSKIFRGRENLYFTFRMDAAAALYKAGKIRHLLLSGAKRPDEDEPADMKQALLQRGVPASAMTLDPAGFRTLDSILRSKQVYQQTRLTVISQRFHNARALFLARYHGIEAVGYNARNVHPIAHRNNKLREWLARVKAVLDLYLLRTQAQTITSPQPIRLERPPSSRPKVPTNNPSTLPTREFPRTPAKTLPKGNQKNE